MEKRSAKMAAFPSKWPQGFNNGPCCVPNEAVKVIITSKEQPSRFGDVH